MDTRANRFGALFAGLLGAGSESGWRPRATGALTPLAALAAGALAVLAFAPFSFWPAAPVAVAVLIGALQRCSPRAGFWRGYAFGLGLFGVGVSWIRISLNEFGNMDAWLADLMMLLFVATIALFYGLFGWLVRRLDAGYRWATALLLSPGLYLLLEWLRGWLFTGFPWLNLGYTQIQGPLAGFAPIVGVYGLTLLVALSGGLLFSLVHWRGPARAAAAGALLAIGIGGELLARLEWSRPLGEPLTASVLQANIPQAMKWEPDALIGTIESYLEMTREHLDSDLILWPETAIPAFLHQVRARIIDPLAERAGQEGAEVVFGIPVFDEASDKVHNGLVAIGSGEDLYAKRHLVPFGEFMPFKSWLGPLAHAFEVPMSDFTPGNAEKPILMIGAHPAAVSICYEDAFPEELIQALPEAELLVNVSNDAWFGDSWAPHQHLEIARMRALETARAMVRATNTGISAIIDHRGRVLGEIPYDVRGTYTDHIQPRTGATPFVRAGNWPAVTAATALVLLTLLLAMRRNA